jgi:RNAse (barnase) inhibitor barstar
VTVRIDPVIYVLDGRRFSTLEEFYADVSSVMIPGAEWGRNLDAFNDILRGGFGTPDGAFTITWIHSARSRQVLGYPETVRQLKQRAARTAPVNQSEIEQQIRDATYHTGPTVFDWLVDIIRAHRPGGPEDRGRVELILK